MRALRRAFMTILLAIGLLIVAPVVHAFDGRSGDRVVIAAEEVISDDLYAAANEVVINGQIEGSLLATGRQVRIERTAKVARNLIVAAQFVQIEGGAQIGGDLIAVGQDLRVDGSIAGSVIGFSAQMDLGGQVGGDLVFWGGDVGIAGQIARDGLLAVEQFELSGRIERNLRLVASQVAVDPAARIGGDLHYRAPEAAIPAEIVAGQVQFTPSVEEQEAPLTLSARVGEWSLTQLRRWISLLLVGAIMVGFAFRWTQQMADQVQQRPLANLGWGFVALIITVGGALAGLLLTILFTVLLGVVTLGDLAWRIALLGLLAISGMLFLFSLVWAYLSQITVSFLVGRSILGTLKSSAAKGRWGPLLIGSFLLILLTAIPYLSTLATLVVVLLGLGSMARWAERRFRQTTLVQPG
ncbi:MAG: polymer-forming cytoskeletal protein [Anaerolineae bacterium]|nr:polymer-forming cytoskeletal protein [Anaerolineae bacterium]MDW8099967.1 polymer-forming cytoskeletal protein [Anaerolineae bacterium]